MVERKEVKGYDGKYFVSDEGQIVSFHFNKPGILKTNNKKCRYLKVSLVSKGKRTYKSVHSIVANAFVDKPNKDNLQINHIDGNRYNNKASNLEWCTAKENIVHAYENNLIRTNNKIILTNLKTKEEYEFLSQRKASRFLGRKDNYVCRALKRGSNTIRNIHGEKFLIIRKG